MQPRWEMMPGMVREYHAGLAVRSGIDAALAAQRGFIAEEGILEAEKGFFRVFGV